MTGPIRIANASGFYGDRAAALAEALEGDVDVVTGDYLAELTMMILALDRLKSPDRGHARTFLRQLEGALGPALDSGTRIVTNAGGLNPAGLADSIRELAARLGLACSVAHVEGDDLTGRADDLGLDSPLAVNAYLGAFGIAAALGAGADVVVTGRVTDASLVVGPAAAHFGWTATDHDALAGAVVAGHVIECGAQATGGNFSFFTEIADLVHPGFPIAEVHADGSSVITKHEGTGGAVLVGTVTAQLLYEVAGPRYYNPDATARLDTIALSQEGRDRVRISGVKGEAPPKDLKVSMNHLGGIRNEFEVVLTGLDIEAKAALFQKQFEAALPSRPAELTWELVRLDRPDADTEEKASAMLRCVVRDADPKKAGRQFTSTAVELALASYPGFHVTSPPTDASPYGVFHAEHLPAGEVAHVAVLPDGRRVEVESAPVTRELEPVPDPEPPLPLPEGPTRRVPLGAVAGARSGDKGGDANVGVWVRSDDAYAWLVHTLTVERFRELLPETAGLPVERYPLPNLRAVNFVVEGILGEGVSSNARFDPQAKALGEWLRSRHLDVPEVLL